MNEEVAFTKIFEQRGWGGNESVSGPGSDLVNVKQILCKLPGILRRLGIRSLVDAPCGDMNWMRTLEYKFDYFIGVDIVHDLVDRLLKKSWPEGYHFQVGNIITDILPFADALFCRDCLVHLPFKKIYQATRLFKRASFRYIIATTFPAQEVNHDCETGEWRPLNMSLEPFFWKEPLLLLPEREPDDGYEYPDKSLGVWALDTIIPRGSILSE